MPPPAHLLLLVENLKRLGGRGTSSVAPIASGLGAAGTFKTGRGKS